MRLAVLRLPAGLKNVILTLPVLILATLRPPVLIRLDAFRKAGLTLGVLRSQVLRPAVLILAFFRWPLESTSLKTAVLETAGLEVNSLKGRSFKPNSLKTSIFHLEFLDGLHN